MDVSIRSTPTEMSSTNGASGGDLARIPHFSELLLGLMNSDNNIRSKAEKEFEKLKGSAPDSLVMHLLEVLIQQGNKGEVRSLAAVLLRGTLSRQNRSVLQNLQQQTIHVLKSKLLETLSSETNVGIRRRTCDMVGEVGNGVIESGSWPEVFQFILHHAVSSNPALRESALLLLQKFAGYVSNHFSEQHDAIHGMLKENLVLQQNTNVSIAALSAWTELVSSSNSANDRKRLALLSGSVVHLVSQLLSSSHQEANEALQLLIELCELHSKIFKNELNQLIPLLCKVMSSSAMDSSLRQLTLEVVVTMVENKPAMLRKIPNNGFVEMTIPGIFSMMVELPEIDQQDWAVTKEDEEDDVEIFCAAAASLDRIAVGIGAEAVLPLTFKYVSEYARRDQWQGRHAALVAVSQVSEVVPTQEPKFGEVVSTVVDFMTKDTHPKVRSAAIAAIGNLCVDGAGKLQQRHHRLVLPALVSRLDQELPRLKARAATAIDFFVVGCERPEILEPYLEGLLEKLFSNLTKGTEVEQEAMVSAISSLAYSMEAKFSRFYKPSVPILKQLVNTPTLKAKAVECIAAIGKVSGKEVFRDDALWLMKVLATMEDDDRACVFSAWCSICECFGDDFEPYLGLIMPSLLKTASIVVDYDALAALYAEEDLIDDDADFVNARTSDVDDKITACSMLAHFCRELGPAFFPFLKPTATVLGPLALLDNELQEEIRMTAVAAMPDLVAVVARRFAPAEKDRALVTEMFNFAMETLLQALASEDDIQVLMTIGQAIKQALAAALAVPVGYLPDPTTIPSLSRTNLPGNVSVAQLDKIVQALIGGVNNSMQRRALRAAERQVEGEDYDEDIEAEIAEEQGLEDEFRLVVSQAIGEIIPLYPDVFMQIVDSCLLRYILDMAHPKRLPSDRKFAVFVIDDIVEHTGLASQPNLRQFFSILVANSADGDDSLRQAAVYGLGVCAETFGKTGVLDSEWSGVAQQLTSIINAPSASIGHAVSATDNAISALGKICRNCSGVDTYAMTKFWLHHLPLQSDVAEGQLNLKQLIDLVQQNNEHVLGHNGENLPCIAKVLALSVGTDNIPASHIKPGIALLDSIKSTLPSETMQKVWSAIPDQHKQLLEQAVKSAIS